MKIKLVGGSVIEVDLNKCVVSFDFEKLVVIDRESEAKPYEKSMVFEKVIIPFSIVEGFVL